MAFEAKYLHGDSRTMDYTPGADVSAGDVVVISNTVLVGIARESIANAALGALDVGGGIYDVKVVSNYAQGSKVYWDNSLNAATTTSTNNTPFGFTVETSPAANSIVEVMHWPF